MLEETDPVEVPAVPLEDSQEVEVAPISAAAEPTEVLGNFQWYWWGFC